jgi:hypothetical protein
VPTPCNLMGFLFMCNKPEREVAMVKTHPLELLFVGSERGDVSTPNESLSLELLFSFRLLDDGGGLDDVCSIVLNISHRTTITISFHFGGSTRDHL